MERDQKKYANAGHSQSTQHGNYNTSTPSDGCMNGITILDTNNVVVADAPQSIDEVTSDGKRSDDNVYNTGPMSSILNSPLLVPCKTALSSATP
jgi:hypothetical protein